jgi:hypothetical protein
MEKVQQYPVCGFVPPYILSAIADSAIAKSDHVGENSRTACKHTLEHGVSYATQRHELCARTQVSPPDAGKGFNAGYILRAIAESSNLANSGGRRSYTARHRAKEDLQL